MRIAQYRGIESLVVDNEHAIASGHAAPHDVLRPVSEATLQRRIGRGGARRISMRLEERALGGGRVKAADEVLRITSRPDPAPSFRLGLTEYDENYPSLTRWFGRRGQPPHQRIAFKIERQIRWEGESLELEPSTYSASYTIQNAPGVWGLCLGWTPSGSSILRCVNALSNGTPVDAERPGRYIIRPKNLSVARLLNAWPNGTAGIRISSFADYDELPGVTEEAIPRLLELLESLGIGDERTAVVLKRCGEIAYAANRRLKIQIRQ